MRDPDSEKMTLRLPAPIRGGPRGDPRLRLRPRGARHGQAQEDERRGTHADGSRGVQAGVHEQVGAGSRRGPTSGRHDYLPPNWVAGEPPTFLSDAGPMLAAEFCQANQERYSFQIASTEL